MKVFICWSEERSKRVAETLRIWLKKVIQQLDPWFSTEDIRAGTRWHPEITGILAECKFGIVCLTPENLKSPWIHFESGALSKTVERTYVCPYLIGIEPNDVPYPLAQFQMKKADKEGTFDIIKTINSVLAQSGLKDDFLRECFEMYWPQLEDALKKLPSVQVVETKRKPEDMLEEILVTVRGLSNMMTKQTSPTISGFLEGSKQMGLTTWADVLQVLDKMADELSKSRQTHTSKVLTSTRSEPAITITSKSESE
jgi:hypothetical protein